MSLAKSLAATWHAELSNRQIWQTRAVVVAFGALSGLTVVTLTWLSEQALMLFHRGQAAFTYLPLLWTPLLTLAVVWATRRFAPGAAGSGIPQVMAALHPQSPPASRGLFVSIRLTLAKMVLTATGLLSGLSLGREGPSVQIGAGVMHAARRFLPTQHSVSDQGLLIAGGSAGIAAAFNTPLGGIMFAIEELSRRPEQRNNGLIMAAIVVAGLMGVSVFGNATHFGVIRVQALSWSLLGPALLVAGIAGVAGGLFARVLTASLAGTSADRFSQWRRRYPLRFAAGCGLAVALIGLASQGSTFGSGYAHTRGLLDGHADALPGYSALKWLATWITAWSGVPGGIFAPSLAIGASLGADVAAWTGQADAPALIALGMAGFLAAVTQAPLTSFIIVMEMVDGHSLVLSLMASALVASAVSRWISSPLYASLAELQLQRLPGGAPAPDPSPAPAQRERA
ncbi:chloride channel protein [Curvibacter sp. HBC61]|uniref:Chloride channel protein n=1 Tax=Curvibacter cyanobacteriorum TaxID=3026422 RepID=A0ABT5N268_9BURK|nr:chloride channel protein [Curvibacter sp. HBC61]MDD0840393.1 chloride channel protein [Curvibacter sp. HBC61]